MEYELQSKPLDRLYLNKIFNNNDELIRGVKLFSISFVK